MVDYTAGWQMGRTENPVKRRMFLVLSLMTNLGILAVFKYFNFFSSSFNALFKTLGLSAYLPHLNVLLPLGISFYTFQTLSYTIDVYRKRLEPQRHLGVFALYVSFFPQLVAGPIERAGHLLPQFFKKHDFDYPRMCDGLKLMLWGFFKKIVIADRLAFFVNFVYGHPAQWHGATVYIATTFFAFQIYCDFSGYSDIAIGAARIMGFEIMENFRRPYFAVSIAEFWRRWHISLSTWFRDYLYIPLGGNRVPVQRWYLNLIFVFVISGLWHGANWTFVVWGALHGFYMLFSVWTEGWRRRAVSFLNLERVPALYKMLRIAITYHLVLFSWIFFRAQSLRDVKTLIINMFSPGGNDAFPYKTFDFTVSLALIALLIIVHLLQSRWRLRDLTLRMPKFARWIFYYAVLFSIIFLGKFEGIEFIYFQF